MTNFRLYWPDSAENKPIECLSFDDANEALTRHREYNPGANIHLQFREDPKGEWITYEVGHKLKAAARDALSVQNACNASGVVASFARHMHTLCEIANAERKGTAWKNSHPVVFLFAHKILSLAGHEDLSEQATRKYLQATLACEELSR